MEKIHPIFDCYFTEVILTIRNRGYFMKKLTFAPSGFAQLSHLVVSALPDVPIISILFLIKISLWLTVFFLHPNPHN